MTVSGSFQGDGNTTGATVQQRATNPKGYCWAEQPPWSAYRESSFGHGTLDVINATHALWSAVAPFSSACFHPCMHLLGCSGVK